MNQNSEFTAIDLLEKVLEFTTMTPNPNSWNFDSLKSNPPRLIRFQQIDSLMKAFFTYENSHSGTSKLSIESFLEGDFILERDLSDYEETIQFIKDFLKEETHDISETSRIDLDELEFIYSRLLSFKKQLLKITNFNSDVVEASSISARFSYLLTGSISKSISEKPTKLDEILELLINPNGLSFTLEELISKYDFPTEDLIDIDIEYM
ncbi:MAG TPA: hypothetical protein PK784_05650 [Tenuifilaceae bacterium]|nr:hypothetical protein [Tenuifilaceae bacterium]HPN21205.1 hypothetical protein [Tenuifilaceae bacterium]